MSRVVSRARLDSDMTQCPVFYDPSDLICISGQSSSNRVDLLLTAKNTQVEIGLVYIGLILGLVSTIPMVCRTGFAN